MDQILTVTLLHFLLARIPSGRPGLSPQGRVSSAEDQPAKPTEQLDINRASAEELAKLPGIGPELGNRIVSFRDKHGPFRRVEDVLAVRGIGDKKWKAIRPYLRVGNVAATK